MGDMDNRIEAIGYVLFLVVSTILICLLCLTVSAILIDLN